MSSPTLWHWTAPLDLTDNQRIDQVIPKLFTQNHPERPLSRTQFQNLLETGNVFVNGSKIKSSHMIEPGDQVTLQIPEAVQLDLKPINLDLQILFEDEHLAVINKPPGISVHPSETDSGPTLVHGLLFHFKNLSGIGGVLRPGIVHRLDKNTSGALVVTKTDAAHLKMSEIFSEHHIQREYWALCYGAPLHPSEKKIETRIARHPNDRKKMAILAPTDKREGKNAITFVRQLEAYAENHKLPFASQMACRLETGRTHQVRVHLTSLNLPLMGDTTYGKPKTVPETVHALIQKLPGQALHARILGFKHPITGKDLHFEAEPFTDFLNLLKELRRYAHS